MAKKISKHSRAARRGYLEVDGEAKSLESVPRADTNDVKKSIIRTVIKNEDLLNKKIESKKMKKSIKKKSNASRLKTHRSLKTDGVLSQRIEKSIERARFVQSARKSDWSTINGKIKLKHEKDDEKREESQSQEMDEDEEYVNSFFNRSSTETDEQIQDKETVEEDSKGEVHIPNNRFSLLEETEA